MPRPASSQPRSRSTCPVASTLDLVGDRWSLVIVRDLLGGKTRFGELLASAERIPSNILAERLKRLEQCGLISSTPYSQHPPRVEYHLTPAGRELGHTVDALATWGVRHIPGTVRRVWPRAEPPEPTAASV